MVGQLSARLECSSGRKGCLTRMLKPQTPPPLSVELALFLDFDGTLAPIQPDPDSVAISDDKHRVLTQLADKLHGALALVSGRDIRDLSKRVPGSVWRAGNHGLYACEPGQAAPSKLDDAPDELVRAFESLVQTFPGTRLEIKGKVLTLHYRNAPESENSLTQAAEAELSAFPEYKLQNGKFVLEAKPKGANKGEAVRRLMGQPDFQSRIPVMVGDDTTDEDAMSVVKEFGGWSVKVGPGETIAAYRLEDTDAVWNWLSKG